MVKKILIIESNYYTNISFGLRKGVTKYFEENFQEDLKNYEKNHIKIDFEFIEAPGSFEIPFLINKNKDLYDGFVAIGCIIRGETYHFEVISNVVAKQIMELSININKPIGFGILTCDNIKQAEARSSNNKNNKGAEAAKACLKVLFNGQ